MLTKSIVKKVSSFRSIRKWVFWNPCFTTDCREVSTLIRPECVFIVCLWEISSQLNQENGKSYGTGFFGKVQI